MSALWRPFSSPGAFSSLEVVSGQGTYIYDRNGRAYLNATGGLWNVSLGLGNAQIINSIREQLEKLAYAPLFESSHPPAELLAKRLIELSEGTMHSVYLSTTGTSAVEIALRVARLHYRASGKTRKNRILSFDLSYHGCSAMNLSASGIVQADVCRWGERLPGFQTIPSPIDEQASLSALADLLESDGEEIACLIMEPILGSGGIIVPTSEYCQTVRRLCRAADILLIADEVATGGGRCGSMFASTPLCLEPDIIALSKGLNSGYFPVGATLFSADVVSPIQKLNAQVLFGSTQDGNPVGCMATLATLDMVLANDLCTRSKELGFRIRQNLEQLAGTGIVKEVRGMGLMIGIELTHSYPLGRLFTEAESERIRQKCQDEGLLVYIFNSGISLFPPLTTTNEEAEDMLEILRYVLGTY